MSDPATPSEPDPTPTPPAPAPPAASAPAKKTPDERKEILSQMIANQLARSGYRIESRSDFDAVLVRGKPVNHVLHLLLTIFTLGLWIFVWIVLAIIGGEKREMVSVDEFGRSSIQQL